ALDAGDGTGRDAHPAIRRSFSVMANKLLVLLAAFALVSPASTVVVAQSPLQLRWELLSDSIATNGASSRAQFTLTNRDTKPLPKSGWAIYYSALHSAQPDSS